MSAKLKPVHPGEILKMESMEPLGLNPHKLSRALRVSAPAIYDNRERKTRHINGHSPKACSVLRHDA